MDVKRPTCARSLSVPPACRWVLMLLLLRGKRHGSGRVEGSERANIRQVMPGPSARWPAVLRDPLGAVVGVEVQDVGPGADQAGL